MERSQRRRNVDNQLVLNAARDAELTPSYVVLAGLAGVLAAVSFLADSVPILIGAMIVAPIYPPLMLVILAFAGGQGNLAWRGLGRAILGLVVATLCATGTSWLIHVTGILSADKESMLAVPLLEERVRPGWYSAIAALAAGIAGTLGYLKQKTDTLIGTVASVALVPAASAGGIAAAVGDPTRALGALVLLGLNVALILATGLLVVVAVRPGPEPDDVTGR
jgi:uncharacterized hydrophobic protein (TIGR00271 family)